MRRVDLLIEGVETTALTSEEFLRGPFLAFLKQVPHSPVAVVVRLLVAEGWRHPDLRGLLLRQRRGTRSRCNSRLH